MTSLDGAHVLVTGGAGFIGSHTVERLLRVGARVRVLDNLRTGRVENVPNDPHLEFVHGDACDPKTVRQAVTDVTHVLHLAAQVSVAWSIENPVESCRENVMAFVVVLEAARQARVRFVYASSTAVYGDTGGEPASEMRPLVPLSPYGLEKLIDERYAALYTTLHGYRSLGLRYFNVYGPRQDPHSPYSGVIPKFLAQITRGESLTLRGDGLQERDFVHVLDVARINVQALAGDASGVLNVARGESVTIRTLIATLERIVGRSLPVSRVSESPGEIRFSRADVSRLHQDFGLPQITLEEGLRALLEETGMTQGPYRL